MSEVADDGRTASGRKRSDLNKNGSQNTRSPVIKMVRSKGKVRFHHEDVRKSLFEDNPQWIEYDHSTTTIKSKRRHDRRNYCIYCQKLVLKLARHMINNHKNEPIIAQYKALLDTCPKESQQRRRDIISDLTRKGNNIYNKSLREESGTVCVNSFLPVRRPPLGLADNKITDYVNCTICHGLFKRKHFYQHASNCIESTRFEGTLTPMSEDEEFDDDEPSSKRRSLLKEYGAIYCINKSSSEIKSKIIDTTLRKDEIGTCAMGEESLVELVSDFYSNNRAYKCKGRITNKLRDGAKLLRTIQEIDPNVNEFQQIFNPNRIESVVKACQIMCGLEDPDGKVIVGMSSRLKWILEEGCKKIIDSTVNDNSKTDDQKNMTRRQVKYFQECLKRRWKYISTNVEQISSRNKIEKPFVLPLDEDIISFVTMLRKMENDYTIKLEEHVSVENYETLCKVVICHILTLNRRRPIEATQSEIECYLNKKNENNYYSEELLKTLAEEERVSLHEITSYAMPAKESNKIATILLTKNMERSINTIIKCRHKLNLNTSVYLFARPGLTTPFDESKVMREVKALCPELKNPEYLTATGLRHHAATLSLVNGGDFTSEFMCDSQTVHCKDCALSLPLLHRRVIGKNLAGVEGTAFKQTNNECQLPTGQQTNQAIVEYEQEDNEEEGKQENEEEEEEQQQQRDEEREKTVEYLDGIVQPSTSFIDHDIIKKNFLKRRWSEEEKRVVVRAFSNLIRNKQNPGIVKSRELILECGGLLNGRTPLQINAFVDNINKGKTPVPKSYYE